MGRRTEMEWKGNMAAYALERDYLHNLPVNHMNP